MSSLKFGSKELVEYPNKTETVGFRAAGLRASFDPIAARRQEPEP